ncbi:MAG TPA: hypothetical protein VJN18_20545 [Polyangiaceae bacterium]|nr:hypothetical protein [Polyangiaceae bacterium]
MTRLDRLALGGAAAIPWLFIWQGLDFTDQGYSLTNYRCFLRHPEATADSGALWLTNLIGALWDAAFGGWGVVGMRALWALCLSVGMLLAFRLLRELTSERAAALAVLVSSAFLANRRETWFSYNTSTSLLLVAAAFCLISGIINRRPKLLFGAGVWIGVLPFARFPNVLAVALLAAPAFVALIDAERRPRLLRDLGLTALGVAAGVAGTLALIYLRGDARLVFDAIADLFAPSAAKAGYGTTTLLEQVLSDHGRALAAGLAVCVVGALLARLLSYDNPYGTWILLVSVASLMIWGLYKTDEYWRFFVVGTTYWVLGAVACGLWKLSIAVRVACFAALVVVFIAPLGSGNGIKNAHMGLWLGLPLLLALLFALQAPRVWGQGFKLALLAGVVLLGEAGHRAAVYTYRDAPRARLVARVNHPQLRAQFTTPARAQVVQEVLDQLKKRVKRGDYLLAYEGTPLLYYLTKTRPYLNRPWPMSAAMSFGLGPVVQQAPKLTGCLPVAVLTTKTTRTFGWPEVNNRLEQRKPIQQARKAIRSFLRRYDYSQSWRNDFFVIVEPPPDKRSRCR